MSFNITAADLDRADDKQYTDYIVKTAMRDGKLWALMLEEERVDRTQELMRDLKSSIEQQLGQAKLFQSGGEVDWRRRTTNLLRRVETYLADVKAEVKRLDHEEQEESVGGERDRWRSIAGALVDLLAGNPALALIQLPAGNFTAAEWAELRAAKREQAAA